MTIGRPSDSTEVGGMGSNRNREARPVDGGRGCSRNMFSWICMRPRRDDQKQERYIL